MPAEIKGFFHAPTFSLSYVVSDPGTKHAVIIDPALDFDYRSGRTGTAAADEIVAYAKERGLMVDWILETHAHADRLTAAPYLKRELGGKIAIGEGITGVQKTFAKVFNLGKDFVADGSQFDRLFADGDTFSIGNIEGRVWHTPGHTSDSVTYVIEDAAFLGDTLFMPDFGSARCDFPGGDAALLFESIQKIYDLGDDMRLFMCHDYQPGGRELLFETTVAGQKERNIHVADGINRDEFVKMRRSMDAQLSMPKLILPSIQVNIRAGELPDPESNGVAYLKLPLNQF
ncbi:MAG: MBL fold metallo-hydrolase [Gammaproteobacteria bacterium]|nr:MAG: MBL fold metallo-hydrolase [Gammaproteobacteria bacterium]